MGLCEPILNWLVRTMKTHEDPNPKLTLTLRETNPDWEAVFEPGNNHAVNMDDYRKDYEIDVEIVQLNLNSGGMRVRYEWPDKNSKTGFSIKSCDVSIKHFFEKFEISTKSA